MFIPILRAVLGGRGKEQEEGVYNDKLCVIVNPHRYTVVCEEDTMEIEEEEGERDRWAEERDRLDMCNIVLAEREKRVEEEEESEEERDEERYQRLQEGSNSSEESESSEEERVRDRNRVWIN